jgi:hypothetical protein
VNMIIIILVPQTNEHYKPISRRQLFLPGVWNDNNMPQGFKAQMARPRIVVTKATNLTERWQERTMPALLF